MKNMLVCFALALMMIVPFEASDYFCSKKVIDKVESHTAIVIGYFENEHGEYVVAYGAGGVLRDNHVISAMHIMDDDRYDLKQAYVTIKGLEKWVKADIIAEGHAYPEMDDYVILKATEDLGLSGLKIAKKPLGLLQKVLFAGTPGGAAFFVRGGYVSMLQYYVARNDDETFALKKWADYPSPVVYIAYPGDSGGIITNTKGEIQSLMMWGDYGRDYVVGNPVGEIWKFLKKNKLEHLGKGSMPRANLKSDPDFREKFRKWIFSSEVQSFFDRYRSQYPEAYQELLTFLRGQL